MRGGFTLCIWNLLYKNIPPLKIAVLNLLFVLMRFLLWQALGRLFLPEQWLVSWTVTSSRWVLSPISDCTGTLQCSQLMISVCVCVCHRWCPALLWTSTLVRVPGWSERCSTTLETTSHASFLWMRSMPSVSEAEDLVWFLSSLSDCHIWAKKKKRALYKVQWLSFIIKNRELHINTGIKTLHSGLNHLT